MTNQLDIVHFVSVFYDTSAFFSIISNTLLIYIIATKSPKHFGAYRNLLMIDAVFEVVYSCIDFILLPIHFSYKSTIIVFSASNYDLFGSSFLSILDCVFWGLFGASHALFAVNFVYRYLVISEHKLLNSFISWRLLLWLLLPFSNGLIWFLTGIFLCGPNEVISESVRDELLSSYGKNVDELVYRGVRLYQTDGNGKVTFRFDSLVTVGLMLTSIIITFFIIIVFGVKCYDRITSAFQIATSSYHQNLQKQLFYALVIQTVIPILLLNFPIGVLFVSVFMNIGLGTYSALATMSITLYPAIDPFPNFFIIKPYRDALTGTERVVSSTQPSFQNFSLANHRDNNSQNNPVGK